MTKAESKESTLKRKIQFKENSKKLDFHDKDNWIVLALWLIVTLLGVFQTATSNGGKFNAEILKEKGYWAWFIAPSHLIFIGLWLIFMIGLLISIVLPVRVKIKKKKESTDYRSRNKVKEK